MNSKDWTILLSTKLSFKTKKSKELFNAVFDMLKDCLGPDEPIKISEFGTFKIRKTMTKIQINISSGLAETVPEHNVVVFKPSFEIEPKPTPIPYYEEILESEEEAANEVIIENMADDMEDILVLSIDEPAEYNVPKEVININWEYKGIRYSREAVIAILKEEKKMSIADIDKNFDVISTVYKNLSDKPEIVKILDEEETFAFKL